LRFLLHPHRLNRIIVHHATDKTHFSLAKYLEIIEKGISSNKTKSGSQQLIKLAVEKGFYRELIRSLKNPQLGTQAKATLLFMLTKWKAMLIKKAETASNHVVEAHYWFIQAELDAYLDDPAEYTVPSRGKTPDGSPIGMDKYDHKFCAHD